MRRGVDFKQQENGGSSTGWKSLMSSDVVCFFWRNGVCRRVFQALLPFSSRSKVLACSWAAGPEGGEGVKAQVHPSRWTIQNSILKGVERDSNALFRGQLTGKGGSGGVGRSLPAQYSAM
jgi:hypothetical protein